MNCAQRGHSAMSCKNEKVDNMVVDKRIKEAAAELKAQQENEVDNYCFCDNILFL